MRNYSAGCQLIKQREGPDDCLPKDKVHFLLECSERTLK